MGGLSIRAGSAVPLLAALALFVLLILSVVQNSPDVLSMQIKNRPHHAQVMPTRSVSLDHRQLPKGLASLLQHTPFDSTRYPNHNSEELYHVKVNEQIGVSCWDNVRLGSTGDGGWDICTAGPYLPNKHDCLIYSFGINEDWSFDDAISTHLGCDVRSFDPSMETYPNNSRRGDSIDFYQLGLSGEDKMQQFPGNPAYYPVRTLDTIRNYLGDSQRVIDYLKMDVELSEWHALPQMVDSGVLKKYVKQLGVELHGSGPEGSRDIEILDRLEEIGFRKWRLHPNMNCMKQTDTGHNTTFCYEVYYININFI